MTVFVNHNTLKFLHSRKCYTNNRTSTERRRKTKLAKAKGALNTSSTKSLFLLEAKVERLAVISTYY